MSVDVQVRHGEYCAAAGRPYLIAVASSFAWIAKDALEASFVNKKL